MGHCLMIMLMIIDVRTMNMDMSMGVRMFVGMNGISVAMFVGVSVIMLVGVLQLNCVLNHKIRVAYHYSQGNIELDFRSFSQNQHTESNT